MFLMIHYRVDRPGCQTALGVSITATSALVSVERNMILLNIQIARAKRDKLTLTWNSIVSIEEIQIF